MDPGGKDFAPVSVPAHRDLFFDVDKLGPRAASCRPRRARRRSRRRWTTHGARADHRPVRHGRAGTGRATWDIRLDAGIDPAPAVTLGSGERSDRHVPGGYVRGAAPIDQVIGGVAYTVSVPDPRGGTATVSLNPIEILDGQHEFVTVTIAFRAATSRGPEVVEPEQPGEKQPTLPPGAPDPLPGPDLEASASGEPTSRWRAQVSPPRVRVDSSSRSRRSPVLRNLGHTAAVGVVAREIPQYHPAQANRVAHVLSIATTRGRCASLPSGELQPGNT